MGARSFPHLFPSVNCSEFCYYCSDLRPPAVTFAMMAAPTIQPLLSPTKAAVSSLLAPLHSPNPFPVPRALESRRLSILPQIRRSRPDRLHLVVENLDVLSRPLVQFPSSLMLYINLGIPPKVVVVTSPLRPISCLHQQPSASR